jgi:hypothetical protein
MVLLPTFLLLLGAAIAWYSRNRPTRIGWIIEVSTALLVWLVSLILITAIPSVTQVSVWRPQSLFQSQLELKLDSISWPFIYASSTLLLTVVLTYPARYKARPRRRAFLLLYAVFPMMSMLSGNILTFAITWTLMDVASVIVMIDMRTREELIPLLTSRLAIKGGSLLLVLLAAMVNVSSGGDSSLSTSFHSSTAILLISFAAMLRLGFFQSRSGMVQNPAKREGIDILQQLLPAAAALTLFARVFSLGMPEDVLPWLKLVGGLALLVGGVQWVFDQDESRIQQAFKMAISGLGVFVASTTAGNASVIAAAGAIMILLGAVFYSIEIFSPAHRIWPVMCAIVVAGFPGTPGGLVLTSMFEQIDSLPGILKLVVGITGMVLLSLGTLRYFYLPSVQWQTAESSVRFMYGLGLSFPVFVSIGLGLWMAKGFSLVALAGFLAIGGVAVLLLLVIRRLPHREVDRWGRLLAWIDLNPVMRFFEFGGRVILGAARATSQIFEGEGAMLWLVVILLLTFLGVRGIG